MQQRAIKNKIKSTSSIKKITKTMEMISVTKMKKTLAFAESYKNFIIKSKEILDIIANHKDIYQDKTNIFNIKNNSPKSLYIVIAGQKGLAGSYNVNIYRYLNKANIDVENTDFVSINKYGEKIVKKFLNANKDNLLMSFVDKKFTDRDSKIIFDKVAEKFTNSQYSNIFVLYTDFVSATSQEVKCISLLPFNLDITKDVLNNTKLNTISQINNVSQNIKDDLSIISDKYLFEPNFANILEVGVRLLLSSYILYAYTRSATAEHISRMNAMHSATENAGEMISDLKLLYNKSRQSAITQEISEISSGAMAHQ